MSGLWVLQSVGGTHSAPQRRCAEAERWACQRGRWGALPDASSPGGGWPSATGHQRAVSPRRRMHSRFCATRLVKCPGQPRTPRPRVAHEDTASTRRTRQTSLCSGPPCVPSPEAQPLPPQPPLPMWTVPDLGAWPTALRSQSSKQSSSIGTRSPRWADGFHRCHTAWLPDTGPRHPSSPWGVCPGPECPRLGPQRAVTVPQQELAGPAPANLDWAGTPVGGGPLQNRGPSSGLLHPCP